MTAKNQSNYDPIRISVSLLGGSTSGKTTYINGIINSMLDVPYGFPLHLRPLSIKKGLAEINSAGQFENETETNVHLNNPQDTLASDSTNQVVSSGGSAFANASMGNSSRSTEKDDQDVTNITVDGNAASVLRISDEIDKHFNIENKFRPGTQFTKFIMLEFELIAVVKGERKACRFVITDYAGELIDHALSIPSQILDTLSESIGSSDGAIVLASAREMNGHVRQSVKPDESMFEIQRVKEALSAKRLNGIFGNITKEEFAFLVAITQTDCPTLKRIICENNFKRTAFDLKNTIFGSVFNSADLYKWSCGILPVSAIGVKSNGEPNVDNENMILPDAELNPDNIDTSIYFCIYNICYYKIAELERENASYPIIKSADMKARINENKYNIDVLHSIADAIYESFCDKFEENVYEKTFAPRTVELDNLRNNSKKKR